MRKTLSLLLLASMAATASDHVSLPTAGWQEDFNTFLGTYPSLAKGVSVSKDGNAPMPSDDPDFRGLNDGGVTAGGCYAWTTADGDHALGYQPTADEFTPGWFRAAFSNSSDTSYRFLKVSYDTVCLNDADRSSRVDLRLYSTNGLSEELPEMTHSSQQARDSSPQWTRIHLKSIFRLPQPIGPGQLFELRWVSDDAGGSGSRDEIGIDNIKVKGITHIGTVMTVR